MGNLARATFAVCCLFLLSACNIEVVILGEGQVRVLSNNAAPCSTDDQCLEGGYNRLVTLEAIPAENFVFTGWAGACEGMETCTVRTLNKKTVVATFKNTEYNIVPLMNYTDAFFFSGPWPTDLKRKADGRLDMTGYPFKNSLFERAVKGDAATLQGFSRNDAIYIPIATDIDSWYSEKTPWSWSGFTLVNLSPDSPRYLTTIPVVGDLYQDEWLQKDALLRITPDQGYSLDANTTYGLIMLASPIGMVQYPVQQGEAMRKIINGEAQGMLQQHWTMISDYLTEHTSHSPEKVAAFSVFTTQDVSPNLALVRDFLAQQDDDAILDHLLAIKPITDNCSRVPEDEEYSDLLELTIRFPFFLKGKPPFLFSGGQLNLNPEGQLQESSAGTEARVIMVIPCNEDVPEGGYPIEIAALETGGSLDDYRYYGLINEYSQRAIKLYVPAPYTSDRTYDGGLSNLNWVENLLGIEKEWIIFGLGDFNPMNWNAVEPQYLQYASDMIIAYHIGKRLSGYFANNGEYKLSERAQVNHDELTFSGVSLGAMAAVNANTLYQDNKNLVTFIMPRPSIQHINNVVDGLLRDYISGQSLDILEWVLGVEFPVDLNDPTLSVMQTVIDRIDTINHLEYMEHKNVLMALADFEEPLHGGEPSYVYAKAFDRHFGINPVFYDTFIPFTYFPIGNYNSSTTYQVGDWISDKPVQLVTPGFDAWGTGQWFPWHMSREEGFRIQ